MDADADIARTEMEVQAEATLTFIKVDDHLSKRYAYLRVMQFT
jgi:hypothetical protein